MEIQGRTLFEEGWSEIDHDIVYPYFQDDEMLTDFSTLLNRLAGMADEMSSYFRRIKDMKMESAEKAEKAEKVEKSENLSKADKATGKASKKEKEDQKTE